MSLCILLNYVFTVTNIEYPLNKLLRCYSSCKSILFIKTINIKKLRTFQSNQALNIFLDNLTEEEEINEMTF